MKIVNIFYLSELLFTITLFLYAFYIERRDSESPYFGFLEFPDNNFLKFKII